jgi:hypothetical protein
VIRVAVRPPRAEAEIVGPEQSPEGVGQIPNVLPDRPVGKAEAQHAHGATPQAFEGNLRLHRSRRRQVIAQRTSSGVRRLAIGDRDDGRFDTEAIHALDQPAGAQHLVVGVRCHDDEATRPRQAQWWESRELARPEPGSLVGPRMPIVDD